MDDDKTAEGWIRKKRFHILIIPFAAIHGNPWIIHKGRIAVAFRFISDMTAIAHCGFHDDKFIKLWQTESILIENLIEKRGIVA